MRRMLLTAMAVALAGGLAYAQPAAPSNTRGIVTYDANRQIQVTWQDNSADETGFEIQRQIDGGGWSAIGNAATGATNFTDADAKDLNKKYEYRVVAVGASSSSGPSNVFGTNIGVTWPAGDGGHDMMQGFADGSPNSIWEFHEGLDIRGAGAFNTVAMRNGRVARVDSGNSGTVIVEVDVGGGNKEYDMYLHVQSRQVSLNDVIGEGTVLATQLFHFPGGVGNESDHVHAMMMNQLLTQAHQTAGQTNNFEDNVLSPLLRFTKDADRDPGSNAPRLEDTNLDGKKIVLIRSGTPTGLSEDDIFSGPVSGDVDMIADVRDPAGPLNSGSQPYKAGYWIDAAFDHDDVTANDVRSAGSPYVLHEFDDDFFAAKPKTNGKFDDVYADDGTNTNRNNPTEFEQDFRIPMFDGEGDDVNPTVFPLTQNIVLTNTAGGTGNVDKIDGGQYWNTNATDDFSAVTADTANFTGKADAAMNADTRFPDGDYILHVTLGDLLHEVDETAGKIRLDNFQQTVKFGGQGALPTAGLVEPMYDVEDVTPFLHGFDPETAMVGGKYQPGAWVGIRGVQYFAEVLLPVLVFAHRAEWMEDDLLGDALREIFVMTDAEGKIPLTTLLPAGETTESGGFYDGVYDVVVDYDRDGMFSATLDGLGAFRVAPEPGSVGMISIGAMGMLSRKRQKRYG